MRTQRNCQALLALHTKYHSRQYNGMYIYCDKQEVKTVEEVSPSFSALPGQIIPIESGFPCEGFEFRDLEKQIIKKKGIGSCLRPFSRD